MATSMDLIPVVTTLLVLYLTTLDTGNAGIIRRDVPPIAIPINPGPVQLNDTQAKGDRKGKNCSIEVVAFIPLNKKAKLNETKQTEPKKEIVHESYPNPPVPTPSIPDSKTNAKAKDVSSEPKMNDDGTKKWGFNDKYLASQNKYARRRNVVFDVVAGDAMAFSTYNVLGHQEVRLGKK